MKCSLCDRVAWYLAGRKHFCKEHYGNARKAANQDSLRIQSAYAASHDAGPSRMTGKSRLKLSTKGGYGSMVNR